MCWWRGSIAGRLFNRGRIHAVCDAALSVAEGRPGQRATGDHGEIVRSVLVSVGLEPDVVTRYPREFSGGQRQRIALARAILKNAPIFIFDEPVTGLDSATEAKLNETLDSLMKGRTCFTIAHRLSTVMRADLILMIEEGRIVEQGTHESLLAKNDRYRQLYDLQRLGP